MSRAKIREVLDENLDKYVKISSHWTLFQERDTYLIHNEKMDFIEQLNKLFRAQRGSPNIVTHQHTN